MFAILMRLKYGATTLSIKTFRIIITLSIKGLSMAPSINNTQHNKT
jgi:hypothetical protein